MRIVITTMECEFFLLDVNEDMVLDNFITLVSNKTQINLTEILLYYNNIPLNDKKKPLKEFGLTDGEVILARQREIPQVELKCDSFDPKVQIEIEEKIRLKNVDKNMDDAFMYSPENFGDVIMLYINCKVNDYCIKAFVDSGAQITIMSKECAERCNIIRLIDKRWAGIAKGVGTQNIIGRIHLGYIQIGNDYLPSSFSILEQTMDLILGLDILKRYQCNIDMRNYELIIGTTGTKTSFLNESELPNYAKLHYKQNNELNHI